MIGKSILLNRISSTWQKPIEKITKASNQTFRKGGFWLELRPPFFPFSVIGAAISSALLAGLGNDSINRLTKGNLDPKIEGEEGKIEQITSRTQIAAKNAQNFTSTTTTSTRGVDSHKRGFRRTTKSFSFNSIVSTTTDVNQTTQAAGY